MNIDTQTHCYACGMGLGASFWEESGRRFCSAECMRELDMLETGSIIVELEAELAEALELLEGMLWEIVDFSHGKGSMGLECTRKAARLLAKHDRFVIERDEGDLTEGRWIEKP